MKRLFWFAVGVGAAAFVVVKGKELYQRYTPKGIAEQVEKTRSEVGSWIGDFLSTMGEAMDSREDELREALGLEE
ncbi:MAG: hypothetical protein VB080_01595 [Propionicimonas sp.]|uniref:hypothetical protein n=1 Tax=Propionicimonas sp. TaxID=1955623 RepID=UPI002B20F4B5|nr:hypothetical protein [Propionicimonas sp.]MEA4943110.1 hypothetical protein [Propionicimonas sp.]MEA5053961.1 hypothetical protein [Propionicimonas sp.]MEA5117586.1 hypothetical protein [Propionicimonas sp.]